MMPSKTKWTINIKTWTSKSYQQKWSWLFECCCDYLEEREEGCKQSAKVLKSQCYNISILIKDALIWEDDIKQGCFDMRGWYQTRMLWYEAMGEGDEKPCWGEVAGAQLVWGHWIVGAEALHLSSSSSSSSPSSSSSLKGKALPVFVFIINIGSLEPNCFCRQLAASLFPFQY